MPIDSYQIDVNYVSRFYNHNFSITVKNQEIQQINRNCMTNIDAKELDCAELAPFTDEEFLISGLFRHAEDGERRGFGSTVRYSVLGYPRLIILNDMGYTGARIGKWEVTRFEILFN